MKLNFDLNNSVEKTEIVLGKKNYDKFGSIVNITNLVYTYNLMSAKTINFDVHKNLNNQDERLWNQIRDRRLIWVKEYDEWFQISVDTDEENEIKKKVTGITLCEAELGQINVNSTEINTENDIAREDYKNPTVFYKPSEPKESLLHRILKKAPNYSIDHVDLSLWNIQRTFSFDGSTIYDVLGEIAQEIGCLFLFDSSKRNISVYDLQTNCLECGHRGTFTDICPECGGTNLDYGYGYDTSILIDSENLAQNITLTGKQDEVKNYIKICGGDDVINTAISACNPNGTQYIFAFSNEDKEDMSDELSSKLDEYLKEYDRLTPTYKEIMLNVYNKINEQLELEHNMMPDIEQAETNAELELSKLTKASLSPIAVEDVSDASIYTVNNAVLGMAKCIVNSTVYKIDIIKDSASFNNQVWRGKFRLENYSDEEDFAENTGYIEVNVNDDKEEYIKQKIQKTIDRDDVYLVDIFDVKTDLDVFTEELKKYSLSRLKSFESAYQSVIDVMLEANISNDSTYGNLYDELYIPYLKKLTAIKSEYKVRESQLKLVASELETLEKSSAEITSYLNFENYLGKDLWKELCAFRREDTYENSNYVSDGLDDPEILEKAQELLDKARNELITSSTTQWSLSATLYNLLAMPEFSKLTGMFNGGNWIRIKIDDKIYRLRLVHYSISDNDIQNLEVEFSDVTQTSNGVNDVNSLMSKVQSMATNFSVVVHQAEQGKKSFTELDKIRNDGLNVALYNISNSVNQDFIIDEHGITGRMWDDILGTYAPEQTKWINNSLVFTDDYWHTAKCALGKIEYYNPILKTTIKQYGLIADAVMAGILMGNDIIGGHVWSENYTSTTGTHIDLNNGDFSFAGGKLTYNTETDTLNLIGKITFQDFDYSDPEIKEAFRESLGITDVEKDIEDFNNSSVLTPLEKQNMLDDWNIIQEEYIKNIELAKLFEVYDDDITKAYINAYDILATEIEKCGLDDLSTTTSIDTKIYDDINNYHLANVDLANLINEKSKELSQEALDLANTAVSDNILNPSEKRDLINEINDIKSSYQEYVSICEELEIDYSSYANTYNLLLEFMLGENSTAKLDTNEQTVLTDGQVLSYKKCFSDYYLSESSIIKSIQDATNINVENAQDAADKAQEDATAALDLLTAIASDDDITPVEKLQLKEKYSEITSSYNKLLEKYNEDNYGEVAEFIALESAYNTLTELFETILEDMNATYTFSSGDYTRDDYLTYIKNYYEAYQSFINFINTELETNISDVSEIANEAKELGNKLNRCLGFSTEITSDYVISPYIGGGYLKISSDTKGSVVIDPLGINKDYTGYIFGVYNKSDELVMGVDTNGNGVFKGKVTTKSGKIGGWTIAQTYIGSTCDNGSIYLTSVDDSSSYWLRAQDSNNSLIFGISKNGNLYSKNAEIEGTIRANSGYIGAFAIDTSNQSHKGYLKADCTIGATTYRTFIQPGISDDTWVFSAQTSTSGSNYIGRAYITALGKIVGEDFTSLNGYIELRNSSNNSSQIYFGNGQSNSPYIRADVDRLWFITESNGGWNIENSASLSLSDGVFYTKSTATNSSRRYKENILPITDDVANRIIDIPVYSFDYKDNYGDKGMYGVIAEEVDLIHPVAVSHNKDGLCEGVDYTRFIPLMIKKIQMQEKEIQELKNIINNNISQ